MYTDTPQTGIHPDTKMDVQEKKKNPTSLSYTQRAKERYTERETQRGGISDLEE